MKENERNTNNPLVKRGKYFVIPTDDGSDFKELFKRLAAAGAGRPVDAEQFPTGGWTTDLLSEAISNVDPSSNGIDRRTIQHWFQDNLKGISPENIRWLARVFGCDDPEATSEWQAVLAASNRRLADKRKAIRLNKRKEVVIAPVVNNAMEATTLAEIERVPASNSFQRFNLAKSTENLLGGHGSTSMAVVVFTGATALGLISFTLNIHSAVYVPSVGLPKQVGFLWAPNWTVVFLAILPLYLAVLVELLRYWKNDWRGRIAFSLESSALKAGWQKQVRSASYSFWAILLVTVLIASVYNWVATHLLPLLNDDPGDWAMDWGRVAIFHPEIISVPNAIVFSGLVFLYNAFCAYLFFVGLVFLHVVTHDYLAVAGDLTNVELKHRSNVVGEIGNSITNAVFRCAALGLLITILMKLQSSFLQSDDKDFLVWLAADVKSIFRTEEATDVMVLNVGRAPGDFYSFFCVLAIFGTFLNTSTRLRIFLSNLQSEAKFPVSWMMMVINMHILLIGYLLIGVIPGFTLVLFLALLLTAYLIAKPAFARDQFPCLKDQKYG